MKKCLVLPLVIFSMWQTARAEPASFKASSSTSAGQGNFSEDLSFTGEHPLTSHRYGSVFDWSAGYSLSKVPVGTTSNNTHAMDFTAGVKENWDGGLGLNFSNTSEESLFTIGVQGWIGYKFYLAKENGNGFRPSLEPKFTFHTTNFRQSFSGARTVRLGSKRTITRPTSGSENIRQNQNDLGFDLSLWEWSELQFTFTKYIYNKDVSRFLGLLDTPRAIGAGRGAFSTTLGGFPENSASLGLSFFPWEAWELNFNFSRTLVQADGSISKGAKIEVAKELSDLLKVGIGFDHETSQSAGQLNLTSVDLTASF